jgi:hypothetical protein
MTPSDELWIAFGLLAAAVILLVSGMLWLWDWLEHGGPEILLRAVRERLAYWRYRMGKDRDPRD